MSAFGEQTRAEDYALVPATSVGAAQFAAFAAAVSPDEPPEQRIRSWWWTRAEPAFAVAAVHQPSGAMAGVCGGRHCEWMQMGRALPGVAICDWYVDPRHAGKGIGKRLVQHFAAPDRFLYAFSISDAAIANFQKLGWAGPYHSALMMLPLPPSLARHFVHRPGRDGLALQDHDLVPGEPLGALGAALEKIETLRARDAVARMRRGAKDWSWRLTVCGDRHYRACVAHRAGEPAGYVVVRRITEGRSAQLRKLKAAIITDLVAVDDDAAALRALAGRAVAIAAELGARTVVTAMTAPAHQKALAGTGFLTPAFPLVGRFLHARSPQFMWSPQGPGAAIVAPAIALSFADVAVDLDL